MLPGLSQKKVIQAMMSCRYGQNAIQTDEKEASDQGESEFGQIHPMWEMLENRLPSRQMQGFAYDTSVHYIGDTEGKICRDL